MTQGSIAMVSLPVHVAGRREAACRPEEEHESLGSSYVADSPFEGRELRFGAEGFKEHVLNLSSYHSSDSGARDLDSALHFNSNPEVGTF